MTNKSLIKSVLYFLVIILFFNSSKAIFAQITNSQIQLTVYLHGIGNGGDNVSSLSGGNNTPHTLSRQVQLQMSDVNNHVTNSMGTITYNPTTGNFSGTISAGAIISGVYIVKIKTDKYLARIIPGIQNITANQLNLLPPVYLIVGDSNGDNALNILDYNMLLDCFSDLGAPRNCIDANKKQMTDLNDDGQVNQFDYNLFLRELSVQIGDGSGIAPSVSPTSSIFPTPTNGIPTSTTMPTPVAGSSSLPVPPAGKQWFLSWNDEFNGTSVDKTKWRVADLNRDYPNTTRYTPDNVSVLNGILKLTVRNNQQYCIGSACTNWSGGMLESYDAQSADANKYRLFQYGYYEARVRYHLLGCGFWANFWMYARPTGPEEFDQEIMSCTGAAGTTSHADQVRPAYHYSGGTSFTFVQNTPYNDNWHLYGYLWLPGQPVHFYYDGKEIFAPSQIGPTKSMYIDLRAGVGMSATTGGNPGPTTQFPGTAEYDWVRVYKTSP